MQAARHEIPTQPRFDALDPSEWDRLVRLCARFSGSADAADDLAQETLIEAWRHAGSLRDPSAHRAWLSGVARNVCLRWRRQQGRDIDRLDRLAVQERLAVASDGHPELALEHGEMAALLDRALGILPAATRDVLVLRYIDELGNREIAERLALSEGAVAVRLHRGKSALRHALARPELRAEAVDIGVFAPDLAGWQETRIWCPFCGRHHLESRIDREAGDIAYRCAGRCFSDGTILDVRRSPAGKTALTSAKSILSRQLVGLHDYYRQVLAEKGNRCHGCERPVALERWSPDGHPPLAQHHPYGIRIACQSCGAESGASLWHLLVDTPVAARFWRRHPRMRALTVREVEVDGNPALVSGFASHDGAARIEIVSARDTYEILHVDGETER